MSLLDSAAGMVAVVTTETETCREVAFYRAGVKAFFPARSPSNETPMLVEINGGSLFYRLCA